MIQSGYTVQNVPADVVDPLIGRVLNERFRIVEALGAGGMGRVYKAVQAPLDRLVALKILNPHYSAGKDPGFQKRFFLEASVTAKLRHPNTVTVIDYGKTEDGIFYIAMEYLEGVTLAQLLAQTGPLPWTRVLIIGQQVARSLREAHKLSLIHRDLKPANIMVLNQETDHDVVKVLDFGLVKSFLPDPGSSSPGEAEITQAGVILGSPQYMAPEQARNVADPRSDVYSLGVVIYQALMGRPPFQAPQSIDVIFKHLNEQPPPFSSVWPAHGVPPEVESIVMRCLAKRPEDRYQSMDEVLEAMRGAASAAGMSGVFSAPPALNGSGSTSGPHSGPHLSGVHSGVHTGTHSSASTVALDISVEEQPTQPRGRPTLMVGLFAGSLLLGLAVAAVVALRSPPAPAPTPAAAAPAPAPAPATPPPAEATPPPQPEVQPPPTATPEPAVAAAQPTAPAEPEPAAPAAARLLILSEPSGASVTYQGEDRGPTPLTLEVPRDEQGRASAEITLSLAGYQPLKKTVESDKAEDTHRFRLQQQPPPKKSRPGSRPGSDSKYKDDPYQ